MRPLETSVERKIKKWADEHREEIAYYKFTVPGMRGVPDRICLFKGGHCVFIELKRPGAVPRKLQEHVMARLRKLGFPCYVFDSADEAIKVLEEYIELYKRTT